MAFRLYIVPVVGTGIGHDLRRPKYFADGGIANPGSPVSMDYGFEPWFVVGADLSVSDDNFVVGQADAFAMPFDLSVTLNGSQVTNVKAKLEAIHVPAGWVTTALKWQDVVRPVLGMFEFMQRYGNVYAQQNGVAAPPIFNGATLSTQFGTLAAAQQAAMISAAQSFGFSTAGLTSGTTLRVIIKALADNFQDAQYNFGGVMI